MAVVFLCPWLHFRPKHPLKGFLEHFWVLLKLEGLLGAWGLRAEPVPRSNLGSWLLILSLLPGTWGQESWPPLSSCGERPGNTHLSPGILSSCLLVLCCPFLSVEVFCLSCYPAAFFWWKNLILIPSLSGPMTSPALLWLKRACVTLNLNGQSRASSTDNLDCVDLGTGPKWGQAVLELIEIAWGKCPTVEVRGTAGGHLVLQEHRESAPWE